MTVRFSNGQENVRFSNGQENVRFSNGQDYSNKMTCICCIFKWLVLSFIYSPTIWQQNHLVSFQRSLISNYQMQEHSFKIEIEYRTGIFLDFECFWNVNVLYSDTHCILCISGVQYSKPNCDYLKRSFFFSRFFLRCGNFVNICWLTKRLWQIFKTTGEIIR